MAQVEPVVERVIRMLRMVADEKQIEMTYCADERAVALATEDDIHQILYNLMENAIKYSPAGGFVHTAVTVEGQVVAIRVEDNGVGIEDVKKAMEPLFTTGDEEERSGMGFTVMESFMDKLMVVSERGKGTTVIMTKQLDVFSGI